ncbi:MAG: DUF4105 domain-containing protein [Alphaproteobacteria bacterium]
MIWLGAHPIATALIVTLVSALVCLVLILARKPSNMRNWRDHLAQLPHVEMTAERFSVKPERDWSFSPEGPAVRSTHAFEGVFADLKRVWLVVEPSGTSDWTAHTLLMFEFPNDRLLAITIEARLTKGERWTAFRGLWNQFELLYLWASARDVLTGRAVFLKHRVYIYPLILTEEQRQNLLRNMLKTTEALETKPRFYNTLLSNCTNELAKRAGLGWHYSFVLTGLAPYQLFHIGVIPGTSFEDVKAKADFTECIKAFNALPPQDFDKALLAELRKP